MQTAFSFVRTESELKRLFFSTMHLFKAKATLHDYLDLNRRYIKNTDVVLFEDETVRLDIVPKQFFHPYAQELYDPGLHPLSFAAGRIVPFPPSPLSWWPGRRSSSAVSIGSWAPM